MHRQGFRGFDVHADVAVDIAARGRGLAGQRGRRGPVSRALQAVLDDRAVGDAHAGGGVDFPHPAQVKAKAPVLALDIGVAVRVAMAAAHARNQAVQRRVGAAAKVGVLAQRGVGVLGDQADGQRVLVVELEGHGRVDVDGGQRGLVDVIAQHRVTLVFGGRGKRHIHAHAHRHAVVELVGQVHVRHGQKVVGQLAAGGARHGAAAVQAGRYGHAIGQGLGRIRLGGVAGAGVVVLDAGCDQIQRAREVGALQTSHASRVIKQGGGIGGFSSAGIGRGLCTDRLGAEVITGGVGGQAGAGQRAHRHDGQAQGVEFHAFFLLFPAWTDVGVMA